MAQYKVKKLGQFLFKLNHYMRYGYVHYYIREIPGHKDLSEVDRKLLLTYDVTNNRMLRAKRKREGIRNLVYIRFGQTFILLATEGKSPAFDRLKFLNFTDSPLYFSHYSIGIKQNKPYIQIEPLRYKQLKKVAEKIALHQHDKVEKFLLKVSPFSFKGVSDQRWKLYKLVNLKRKKAGLARIKWGNLNKKELLFSSSKKPEN